MTSTNELPFALFVAVGSVLVLFHHGQKDGHDGVGAVLDELEARILTGLIEVVEKDATDTARDSAMLDLEVVVAPGLELLVVIVVMLVAGDLEGAMEPFSIILIQVVGRQITSTSKPPTRMIWTLLYLKVAEIEVDRGYIGIAGMDHGADAAREEWHGLAFGQILASRVHLSHGRGRNDPVDHRDVHTGLFKGIAILDDTSDPTSAFFAFPAVHAESIPRILLFSQLITDILLSLEQSVRELVSV